MFHTERYILWKMMREQLGSGAGDGEAAGLL